MLEWLLRRLPDLRKRAYLARYLVKIDVPPEVRKSPMEGLFRHPYHDQGCQKRPPTGLLIAILPRLPPTPTWPTCSSSTSASSRASRPSTRSARQSRPADTGRDTCSRFEVETDSNFEFYRNSKFGRCSGCQMNRPGNQGVRVSDFSL